MHGSLRSQLKLHLIVFILGFTAILGKLISVPAINLVCYRTLIAFICLYIILLIKKTSIKLPFRSIMLISSIGVIVALHWICFFYAIKVSNISKKKQAEIAKAKTDAEVDPHVAVNDAGCACADADSTANPQPVCPTF